MLNYILTGNTLTVFNNGTISTLTNTARTWNKAMRALQDVDDVALLRAMNTEQALAHYDGNNVRVEGEKVFYKDKELNNCLTQRIIRLLEDDFPIDPLVHFLEKVEQNPSNRAVNELYAFLENNNLPLTATGNFIAYKRIKEDWTDCHSGTISNAVGNIVTMQRNEVNDDPTQTCSHGLHVCSMEYLKNFWGDRLIAVEVSPADVVAVPIDYHNTKMRVCRYRVTEELDMTYVEETETKWKAVYEEAEDEFEDEDEFEVDESVAPFIDMLVERQNEIELQEAGCYGLM